jgi:hypothetical protein
MQIVLIAVGVVALVGSALAVMHAIAFGQDTGFMNLLVLGPAVSYLGIAAFCGFAARALGMLTDIRNAVTKQHGSDTNGEPPS